MSFAAPYDRTTKIISTIVCLMMIAPAFLVPNPVVGAAVGGLLLLVVAASYAYSPRAYAIQDGSIIVTRLIGDVRIPLGDIQQARATHATDFSGCIRLWGSGGLFGYYGLFRTSALGRSTWYITDRSRAVVVVTAAKTVLLSPDQVERFLAAIHEQVPMFAGSSAQPMAATGSRRTTLIPIVIGAILALGLVVVGRILIAGIIGYDPGSPAYTLSGDSLSIRDRFYPVTIAAETTDAEHIAVIDIDRDTGWRPVMRVGGFANAHYQSGWFRTANGTKVRLYRSREARRLVLLPPHGNNAPVLLQVPEPDEFAAQLRRDWDRP